MPFTTLEPHQIQRIHDMHRSGVHVDAIADLYGITRRTVYRYLEVRVERIYVDGWTAWFALGSEKKSPQRLTPWELA